jgi:hypothetical protein
MSRGSLDTWIVGGACCLAGCVTLELPPGSGAPAAATVEDCAGCAKLNDLQGEVILFANGKLSDASTGYTTNLETPQGHYLSGSLFLYQPSRKGTLVKLGNVDFGPDPESRDGYRYIGYRNLAFDADAGLWALTIESLNDEWRLTRIEVPTWDGHDQILGQTTYALRLTDPAYWENELVGMGFVDQKLVLGGRGTASAEAPGGVLYAAAVPTAYGPEPRYPDDSTYYANQDLTTLCTRFPSQLGVAGDLAPGADGWVYAMARSEHSNGGSLAANFLYRFQGACPTEVEAVGFECPVVRNDDFTGLAWVEGTLYAVNTGAEVYRLDLAAKTCELHEALAPLFSDPAKGVRVRGAASVALTHGGR